MHRLEERQYESVRSLFEDLRYNLVVDSVIDGNTPGWVFANRRYNPSVAMMWNRQDAILVAGDSQDRSLHAVLRKEVLERIMADAGRRHIPALSLHYAPEAWGCVLAEILRDRQPEKAVRRVYQPGPLRVEWQGNLPSGCEMQRIDGALLEGDLGNVLPVRGWVLSFWRSVEAFEETGFGYGLVNRETIASWCLSVYASGRGYELGVATSPEYRNQGFATLATAACVGHCEARGWVPHWHCWEDNYASIAVAEKVGFERPSRYTVYRFEV
jgi:GNAT superfamily N-acetyltransferase